MTAKVFTKVAELSSAARALWIVLREEPDASEARLMQVTGYSLRRLEKACAELVRKGLLTLADEASEPHHEQQEAPTKEEK